MLPAPFNSFPCLYLGKEDPKRTGNDYVAFISPTHLLVAATELLEAGYHLEDISGLDTIEGAMFVYHFDHFDTPGRITVCIIMPHESPSVPSIAGIYSGAEWHERETKDFFGYSFTNIPNANPLLIDHTMTEILPLRKAPEKRKSLCALFNTADQEVLFCHSSFTIMTCPAQSEDKPKSDSQG